MGLLPFFRKDLSGASSGTWGKCPCVYTLSAASPDVPAPEGTWNYFYRGQLALTPGGEGGGGTVTPLRAFQNANVLAIERELGDGSVETALLEVGFQQPDGVIEYGGRTRGGTDVLLRFVPGPGPRPDVF